MPELNLNQESWQNYLAPHYWPTWLGLGLLRLLHHLPFQWQLALGKRLGRLALKLAERRAKITRTNIDLCFPDLSDTEREHMTIAHFEAMGMGLFESAMAWWGNEKRLLSLGEVVGLEHLQSAVERRQGVLLLTGHFSTMELAGAMVCAIHPHPINGMYRPMKNPLMNFIVLSGRNNRIDKMFPRDDIASMAKGLRKGDTIWYGFDQNYGLKHSLFTPFFGVPAATITTTSRFAKIGKAAVIPFFPVRNKEGKYKITIHPALANFPSPSLAEDNLRLNTLLEQAVSLVPEQYFWNHRRFKTRPKGEPTLY